MSAERTITAVLKTARSLPDGLAKSEGRLFYSLEKENYMLYHDQMQRFSRPHRCGLTSVVEISCCAAVLCMKVCSLRPSKLI